MEIATGKAAIGKKYKPERLDYSDWVLKQPQKELNRQAYVDGTSFYLATTSEQHEDKQRACLGKHCYRLQTREDMEGRHCLTRRHPAKAGSADTSLALLG